MVKRFLHRQLRLLLVAGIILAILIVLVVLQPWRSPTAPGKIMAKTQTAVSGLQSFRLTLDENGVPGSLPANGNAEFISPNRFHMRITVGDQAFEIMSIGTQRYVKTDEKPLKFSIAFAYPFVSDRGETADLLKQFSHIQELPDEKIDGVECFNYLGQADLEQQKAELIRSILANSGEPTEQQVAMIKALVQSVQTQIQLWIGEDYLVRQVQENHLVPPALGAEGYNVRILLKYFDFNLPLVIESPVDANGQLLPGWTPG